MALRYEWGFDTHLLEDGFGLHLDDGTDSGAITHDDASYCHTDLSGLSHPAVNGRFVDLATALRADCVAVLTTNSTDFTVQYNAGKGYQIGSLLVNTTLDFRSSTLGNNSGINLARALGFTADHADGSGSGYDCVLSGEPLYESNVRPYYLLSPTIQGRSKVRPLYEQPELTQSASADDGTFYFVSRDGSAKMAEWTQTFETDDPPSWAVSGNAQTTSGAPVFKRSANSAVPWSYEHAFEHARAGGSLPFLCVDGSDSIVYQLEAGGTAMDPQRAASEDIGLWNIRFRCIRLGEL